MKNCFLFLAAIIFCTNCQKREVTIVQENSDNYNPMTVEASVDVDSIIIQPAQAEVSIIQEAIKNYTFPSTLQSIDQGLYAFQIEGNFTGSGNREIIAFYKNKFNDINSAFCFVCDSSGEEIANVYYIEYGTIEFDREHEFDTGLTWTPNLGRAITYRNRIIGRVSDFNGNGKEELYMYSLSGMNIGPYFLEFNGKEFVDIINIGTNASSPIISIDPIEKVITLRIKNYFDGPYVDMSEDVTSFIWDDTTHQYEELTSEFKSYRWNRTLREYEEIEERETNNYDSE